MVSTVLDAPRLLNEPKRKNVVPLDPLATIIQTPPGLSDQGNRFWPKPLICCSQVGVGTYHPSPRA